MKRGSKRRAPLRISTKAGTLDALQGRLRHAKVLPQLSFTAREFKSAKAACLARIAKAFPAQLLAVRSSSASEDQDERSNAGHFCSVLAVPSADPRALRTAVESVVRSFGRGAKSTRDAVLVQPMLGACAISGVALTADLDTLAPYYVVNYQEGGQTDAVTSGRSNARTFICFKDDGAEARAPGVLAAVVRACRELEQLFERPHLDIEFAVSPAGDVIILQVRPIAGARTEDSSQVDLAPLLARIRDRVAEVSAPRPGLLGDRTAFGVMPDWNPAEIIGIRPRPLSLSLYKELITDSVWAYQRHNYGYRNLRSHPLLFSFGGVPFIDVRVDFNSFVPAALNERIAAKLVSYYLDKLASTPSHHDKVEFEVVHSCYYLNLPERLAALGQHGFNDNERKRIEFALLELTNQVIDPRKGLFAQDLAKLETLRLRTETVLASGLPLGDQLYWLIEDCKRYGTLPFAGIARAAFIAVQLLRSFVEVGVLSLQERDAFMRSLRTVTGQLHLDLAALRRGALSRDQFLGTYGHLRPGTYDISSPRYDEQFERYFDAGASPAEAAAGAEGRSRREAKPFSLSAKQLSLLGKLAAESGIELDARGLIAFIQAAIEGREQAKFLFTKSLSHSLTLLSRLGEQEGLSRDDMSFCDIRTLLAGYPEVGHRDPRSALRETIAENRRGFALTRALRLPALILAPDQIHAFHLDQDEPNFVTRGEVSAELVPEGRFDAQPLQGRIAAIRSADPGWDFLFTKGIVGLITQYGGANSHMAIRCAELGIPAVIGAGEQRFAEWSQARVLAIDCANRRVTVVR
jgi:phosphohistidine swiveling domain-containing protein